MRMIASLLALACALSAVPAGGQLTPVPPPATATPAHPFFITKSWVIGGTGGWDTMTVDPQARELFIAHGPTVQVVNIDFGTVAGTVNGFRQAHAIVLDQQGVFAYVSDGQADLVRVFDRHSFQVVANIPTGPAPRSLALDPSSGLLLVIGGPPAASVSETRPAVARTGTPRGTLSSVTLIDVDKRVPLAQLVVPGDLGFAQSDGEGRMYVTVRDRNQILRMDTQAVGNAVRATLADLAKSAQSRTQNQPTVATRPVSHSGKTPVLDWYSGAATSPPREALPFAINLGSTCEEPRALAVDSSHARLFAACSNFRMAVINPESGNIIAAIPIGPGPDAIAYDANRSLIFTSNGGGDGSLTIIRQDVTDTYSVIQTLPTRQHASTLAVDPATGSVYLASVLYGAEMTTPMTNGRPAPLKISPVDSSFQVLVVGN